MRDLCNGKRPDVVVEATGSKALIAAASRHLGAGSKFVFLAWYPGDITLDFHAFHARQATAYFPRSFGDGQTIKNVLGALANRTIILGDNITDIVPADRACEGFQRIIHNDPLVMGMVIDWRSAE